MSEYPILFSAPMVRALLCGRKHVTRRICRQWLKVKKGDRLWVRESYGLGGARLIDPTINFRADGAQINMFLAKPGWWRRAEESFGVVSDEKLLQIRDGWIPSIHMPRWASRITLECTEDARSERLWNLSEQEAQMEGLPLPEQQDNAGGMSAGRHFEYLWKDLHKKPGERWEDNPQVVRVGRFEVIA